MKNIKDDVKSGKFKRVYLFCGEEDYLREHYERRAAEKIVGPGSELMDLSFIDGKNYSFESLRRAFETPPFAGGGRLTVYRDSGLVATGKKDESDKAEGYLSKLIASGANIPNVVIFSESKIDKRGKLYKTVEKANGVAEFKQPPEKELVAWVAGICGRGGCSIKTDAAAALIRYAPDMNAMRLEAEKLAAYRGDGGAITLENVELLCVKSIDVKVFALISAIGAKNQPAAVAMYRDLIYEKESPLRILSLIARQFGIIMRVKELSALNKNVSEISEALALRSFIAAEALRQGRLFSGQNLEAAYAECLETDYKIKTGRIAERLGVELLIIKYSAA